MQGRNITNKNNKGGRYIPFFIADILLSETVLRISAYGKPEIFGKSLVVFDLVIGMILGIICSYLREKPARIISGILSGLLFVYFSVNLVYQHTFKSFLSVTQLGMGGDALRSFWKETLMSTLECAPYLIALLLPLLFLILNFRFGWISFPPDRFKPTMLIAILIVAVPFGIFLKTLRTDSAVGRSYSAGELFYDNFVLSLSEREFGALTTTGLEIKGILFGTGSGAIAAEVPAKPEKPVSTKPSADSVSESAKETSEPAIVYEDNAWNIDFASLAASTDDKDLKELDNYFASKLPTKKNAYTGKFKDHNVITLLCESFSPYLIDKDRTPVLYKMANSGIIFSDYYSTVCDNTSNSEYALITGLLPDPSLLGKGWETFYDYNSCTASKNNYLPQCIGNQFEKSGVKSLGFHYYWGNYYGRKDTHPNFGYDFYYMGHDLPKTEDWPTSDLEMMKHSLPKLLTPDENGKIDRFNAYFLTFSGHMYYNFSSNRIAAINKQVSDGLDMSEAARAYVSCNQELENALEYLLAELDKSGVLDNTLIILTQDHYPYTLGLKRLSELAGKDLEADAFNKEFNQYKGSLLMWTPSMEESVHIDFPVCELDILPTLSNLLGFEFDSRLMMGSDVFADTEKIAVLGDRSFVTEDFYYDANTGTATLRTEEYYLSEEELNRLITLVKNKFTISSKMLYTDYYSHIEGEQKGQ